MTKGIRVAFGDGRLAVYPLASISRVAKLDSALAEAGGALLRPPDDLDRIAHRFINAVARGQEPEDADRKKAAWCIWTTRPAVAEDAAALQALLKRILPAERKRPYRQLASAYLTDFESSRPGLGQIATVLRKYAGVAGDPWKSLQATHAVFDEVAGPRKIATRALDEVTNVQRLLANAGLGPAVAEGGFAKQAHLEGLTQIRKMPSASVQERLDLVRRWCLRPDGTMVFGNTKAEMLRTIPELYGGRLPSAAERDPIASFLVGLFGDPRTQSSGWIGIDAEAETLKRWLTEQSLRLFFDIVGMAALPEQWHHRRAFWTAVLDADLISEAWVAFGPSAARQAKRVRQENFLFAELKSGGGQISENHSVLLMQVGSGLIADWSHNGRCNIWDDKQERWAPRLNQPTYTREDLRKALPNALTEEQLNNLGVYTHHGSESGLWQSRVAKHIQRLTGVRIDPKTYRRS